MASLPRAGQFVEEDSPEEVSDFYNAELAEEKNVLVRQEASEGVGEVWSLLGLERYQS